MTEPNAPSAPDPAIRETPASPSDSETSPAQRWDQQVAPAAPVRSAYPAPPGSAVAAPETAVPEPGPLVPTGPTQPVQLHYPSAPPPATPQQHAMNQGAPGQVPQVVHNTVVQNHYHGAGTQLVRTSSRDRVVAVLIALFLGPLGIHRYYLGRPGSATVMLLMSLSVVLMPIAAIWSVVDVCSLLVTSRERFELRYNCSLPPGAY